MRSSWIGRWFIFNLVGALGIAVQIAALQLFISCMHCGYLTATALAVETAVLHNFFWHEHSTWGERCRGRTGTLGRLLRFNLINGGISLAGNLILTHFLVEAFAMRPQLANLAAIAVCSLATFTAGDRFVFPPSLLPGTALGKEANPQPPAFRFFRRPVLLLAFACCSASFAEAAELQRQTITAWNAYINAAERRISTELRSPRGFLALDFQAPENAARERRAVLSGEIPVSPMSAVDAAGARIMIPDGMAHHWRGAVFIPGARLNEVLSKLQNPAAADIGQQDVLQSAVLERDANSLKLYLKLQRSKFVTVVYSTEHQVSFVKYGPTRASSWSVATKIAELEHPNSSLERERPPGSDRGFLWRLNSYWRYEQLQGGIIVECESVTLSRAVPSFLEPMIRPLIDSVARESMRRTLESMRRRYTGTKIAA